MREPCQEGAGANVSFLAPCGLNTGLLLSKGEIHKTFQGLGGMKVTGDNIKVYSKKEDSSPPPPE